MNSFGVWIGAAVAAASMILSASAQNVNPVAINPGGAFNNINVPYAQPYGGGYYNGGYGGVGIVTSGGWGAPIPGYGGYGFGPWGYNLVQNPAAAFPDPIQQQQQMALANSRYDLQTAQTAKAYAQANLFQQQAMAVAQQNQVQQPVRNKFSVRTTASKSHSKAPAVPTVPLDQLVTRAGEVKWPASAPQSQSRDRIDATVATLASQFKEDGKASVQTVNEARDALYAYGLPALAEVRKSSPADASAFKDFLNNMDGALHTMAGK